MSGGMPHTPSGGGIIAPPILFWPSLRMSMKPLRSKLKAMARRRLPWLKTDPIACFRRQCMISCDPDEATIPAVVDFIGEDYVCWASDYPHWDAIFPGAVDELRQHMKELSEAAQRKILGENATRFLNLPA